MENLYQRLIRQLDSLVPFLALARQEGFDLIRQDCEAWFRPEQLQALSDTYREYRCQISHAAFLLGYSYIEAYLSSCFAFFPSMESASGCHKTSLLTGHGNEMTSASFPRFGRLSGSHTGRSPTGKEADPWNLPPRF
jgi:hypothetical protein